MKKIILAIAALFMVMAATAAEQPDKVTTLLNRADSLLNANDASFLNVLEEAYQADTTRAEAAIELCDFYFWAEQYDESIRWAETALLKTNDRAEMRHLYAIKGNSHYSKCLSTQSLFLCIDNDERMQGMDAATKAYELCDGFDSEAYSIYASMLWYTDSVDQAIPLFESCIEKEPHFTYGYCGLAHCHESKEQLQQAVNVINNGLSACDEKAILYHNRMKLMYRLNEPSKAIDDGLEAMQLGDRYSYSFLVDKVSEDKDLAKLFLSKTPKEPKAGLPDYGIGLIKSAANITLGKNKKAKSILKKLIKLNKDELNLRVHIIKIWQEYFPNDKKQLKKMCKQYLAIDPYNLEISYIYSALEEQEVEVTEVESEP